MSKFDYALDITQYPPDLYTGNARGIYYLFFDAKLYQWRNR